MRPTVSLALCAAIALGGAGCLGTLGDRGDDEGDEPGSPDPAGDPTPAPPAPSDNVIDVAIWPRLWMAGASDIVPATTEELCRRMSLDLTGAIPTPAEIAASCAGKTPSEMADAFFATDAFVARETKLWVQHLREDPERIMADHLVDADRLIEGLARGELGYDDFAAAILAHPVTTVNKRFDVERLEDVSENAFRVFLGRMPVGGESQDFLNLMRVWGRDWDGRYELDYGYYVRMAYLDPAPCRDPVYGAAACTSVLLGETTTVTLPLDARVLYETIQGNVPAEVQLELEKPGRLLARRAEFWDEAADHALARFLGWWRSSAAQPETDVPEVRMALASWYRGTPDHDVRDLYRMIVTSVLYTRTADAAPAPAPDKPWAMGPSKVMDATQLLDSLEKALGRELGLCDPHTWEPISYEWYFPKRLRQPQPDDFYGFGTDFYLEYGQVLGGCNGGVVEPTQPGFPSLLAHVQLADALCPGSPGLLPSASATPDEIVAHQFRSFLARAPETDERAAIDTAAAACLPDMSCGPTVFAEQLCGALLRSGAFLFY
jgi:hypothetical protein